MLLTYESVLFMLGHNQHVIKDLSAVSHEPHRWRQELVYKSFAAAAWIPETLVRDIHCSIGRSCRALSLKVNGIPLGLNGIQ